MSDNTGNRLRDIGEYELTCCDCGQKFRSDNPNARYCRFSHKAAVNNHSYYIRHKEQMIARVTNARKRKKSGSTPRSVGEGESGTSG